MANASVASVNRGREAKLVVIDPGGHVLGVTDPLSVAEPWWQEAGPIADVLPGATVLRLLEAAPDDDEPMGGTVSYLVEWDPASSNDPPPLHPWTGQLTSDPQRHPWATVGGPAADLAWVASQVVITGEPRQHRTWNLSAIWSIPTSSGTVWLKCVPPFFSHERAVLEVLGDQPIPQLIAADGHRLLLAELPGEDGYQADEQEQIEMVETLVAIQRRATGCVPALLQAGVPDLRAGPLAEQLQQLVHRLAPNSPALNRLVEQLPERLAVATECGVPDTIVHGDPHGGNCRRGVKPPVWFDWGDCFIGNPLLDLAALHRMSKPAVRRWLELWAEAVPGSDPERAWKVLEPIAALRMAWVYQRFLDNIEQAEHIYHRDDVPERLDQVEELLRG